MIKPKCDICDKELKDFGGLCFSPPEGLNVKKYHICVKCWNEKILSLLDFKTE